MNKEWSVEFGRLFPLQRPSILERKTHIEINDNHPSEELRVLDRKRLELILNVLNHPATERLIDEGHITFGAIKPNAHQSKLGAIDDVSAEEKLLKYIGSRKNSNLKIMFATSLSPTMEDLEIFYKDIKKNLQSVRKKEGSAWDDLITEYMSGPFTYFLLYSPNGDAVRKWRDIIGATDPSKADKNSIRGKFALKMPNNLVHGSSGDTKEKAAANVRHEVYWLRDRLVGVEEKLRASEVKESMTKRTIIRQILQKHGIEMSQKTNADMERPHSPGKWLLRGTTDKTPLFEGKMRPTLGEYGSSGVFFADSPDKVFVYDKGMIIVIRSEKQGNWILYPSVEFEELTVKAAKENGYNRREVVGGLSAERVVFQSHPIYQHERGCATFPEEVDMGEVALILATSNFLNSEDLNKIPQKIREKIVVFDYNTA
jgi:nucleoside-diphosphate kinase